MTINRIVALAFGAAILFCGAANTAQAGIRGTLSVYNQSANPYHIFVEGQRMGTVFRGQTLIFRVQDWRGPTELVAIQAGSQRRRRFVQHVRTCQFARWELHTHWEQLKVFGGPEHSRRGRGGWHYGGWGHGWPSHGGWHHSGWSHGGWGHAWPNSGSWQVGRPHGGPSRDAIAGRPNTGGQYHGGQSTGERGGNRGSGNGGGNGRGGRR
jgi:hypothetical protein